MRPRLRDTIWATVMAVALMYTAFHYGLTLFAEAVFTDVVMAVIGG